MPNKYIPNILIVDDNETNLLYLEALLKRHKVNIIRALSGKEALTKIKGKELALAIVDLQMPEMDGFELVQQINSRNNGILIPIIFLTAQYKDPENILKGYETGAVDYLIKPVEKTILLSKINIFLELDRQKHQIIDDQLKIKKSTYEHKLTKESLKSSEDKYKNMIESSNDLIWMLDRNERFTYFNDNVITVTQYDTNDLMGHSINDFVIKQDQTLVAEALKNTLKGKKQSFYIRIKSKRNKTITLNINNTPITNSNQIIGSISFARDITQQIRSEKKVARSQKSLLDLSMHIEELREKERKQIARDLHDDFGQILTALNIDIAWLKNKLPSDSSKYSIKLDSMAELIKKSGDKIREISSNLRPTIIDDLGLIAALQWQVNEFNKRYDVVCKFNAFVDDTKLSPELSINIYRIIQESLTNVMKHAQATEVRITISEKSKLLAIEISDNGIGIDKTRKSNNKSFGLLGISERARVCGGSFKISDEKRSGTKLMITLPTITRKKR